MWGRAERLVALYSAQEVTSLDDGGGAKRTGLPGMSLMDPLLGLFKPPHVFLMAYHETESNVSKECARSQQKFPESYIFVSELSSSSIWVGPRQNFPLWKGRNNF